MVGVLLHGPIHWIRWPTYPLCQALILMPSYLICHFHRRPDAGNGSSLYALNLWMWRTHLQPEPCRCRYPYPWISCLYRRHQNPNVSPSTLGASLLWTGQAVFFRCFPWPLPTLQTVNTIVIFLFSNNGWTLWLSDLFCEDNSQWARLRRWATVLFFERWSFGTMSWCTLRTVKWYGRGQERKVSILHAIEARAKIIREALARAGETVKRRRLAARACAPVLCQVFVSSPTWLIGISIFCFLTAKKHLIKYCFPPYK